MSIIQTNNLKKLVLFLNSLASVSSGTVDILSDLLVVTYSNVFEDVLRVLETRPKI